MKFDNESRTLYIEPGAELGLLVSLGGELLATVEVLVHLCMVTSFLHWMQTYL